MNWKQLVTDYFTFSYKDRVAVLILALMVFAIWILPYFLPRQKTTALSLADSLWLKSMVELPADTNISTMTMFSRKMPQYRNDYSKNGNERTFQSELFEFDPNSLDKEGWTLLGLKEKTISTIQNYRSRGGHFRNAEDLKKVYGLSQYDFERLKPFIRIEQLSFPVKLEKETANGPATGKPFPILDINAVDTTALIALPGIGSKLANRIVQFREKLGGFHSTEQVAEIYGLADTIFKKIKHYLRCESFELKKLNVNKATIDELKTHPYIRFSLARVIVNYRTEHGNFSSLEELKKLSGIDDSIYRKLLPYFEL